MRAFGYNTILPWRIFPPIDGLLLTARKHRHNDELGQVHFINHHHLSPLPAVEPLGPSANAHPRYEKCGVHSEARVSRLGTAAMRPSVVAIT